MCSSCKIADYFLNGNPFGSCVKSAKQCSQGLVGVFGINNVENPGIN